MERTSIHVAVATIQENKNNSHLSPDEKLLLDGKNDTLSPDYETKFDCCFANRREYIMTDLNTAIAKYKGWTRFNPSTEFCMEYALPDYEHYARLYMALAKEMMRDYVLYLIEDDDFLNHCELWDYPMDGEPYQAYQSTGDEIGTAICLAYCKLKGIEVVG
jgi:hypothetical protein